jgi:hypothetical protein
MKTDKVKASVKVDFKGIQGSASVFEIKHDKFCKYCGMEMLPCDEYHLNRECIIITERMKKEGYFNKNTLETIKKSVVECHKGKLLDDGSREKCLLGDAEMYEHDGGEWVEGQSTKQWIYFTCSRCGYQWSWKRLILMEMNK